MIRMLFAVVLAAPVFAQDMIAVGWSGSVYALDSYTGATNLLGYGAFGQNAVAHDDTGGLWSTSRGASGSVYSLTSLDPATGAASTAAANFSDVRAMESAGGTTLWAIVDGTPDELVTIDVLTSQVTVIGSTGYTGVQAIAALDGVLYGWDVNFGLLTIDPATGNATDVDPAVGGSGDVQWLARRSDGKLVGGHNGLYEIDPSTGGTTQIATGLSGTRGATPYQQDVRSFGTGCAGASGMVTATAVIGSGANPMLVTDSGNHAANAPGLILIGLSSTQAGGVPLPLDLDPIFGTQGCKLYVSVDVSAFAVTSAQAPATLSASFPILPDWSGNSLLLQHVTLEPVAGGLSASNAVAVQFGF